MGHEKASTMGFVIILSIEREKGERVSLYLSLEFL
jgi:hypothetical protein